MRLQCPDIHDQHASGIESKIHRRKVRVRPNQETPAHNQQQRKRHLRDHESARQAQALPDQTPTVFLERFDRFDVRGAAGWSHAEQDGRRDSEACREGQHATIRRQIECQSVRPAREEWDQQTRAPLCQEKAASGADGGQ